MNYLKKRVILSIFASFVLLFGTLSFAFAAVDPLPAINAPYSLRDRFDTDLFTGSATYSYPIKVPKGTDDLTPNVSLSYNSSSAHDVSAYSGMGWDLNKDYVERDVNYTPGSTGDDKFKLHFQGALYDLVYVSGEGRYHTKIESNLNIQKLTTSGTNDYGEYWQVITPDGTKYRFGQAYNSEQVCNGRSYVYRWNLDLVTDVHNNNIYYTYSESNGASYLSQIKYNNDQSREIDFTYGTNPYQKQVYMQGCNIIEGSLLSDIKVNKVISSSSAAELANTSLFSDSNLQTYYKMENSNDSKGSKTLTNNNSVTFSSGLFNNAANFGTSNTSKYLSGAYTYVPTGTDFSVAWFYKGTASTVSFISDTNGSGADEYYFNINSSGVISFHTCNSDGTENDGGYTVPNYDNSIWHHIAFTGTKSGSDWIGKIYFDGVLVSSQTVTGKTSGKLGTMNIGRIVVEQSAYSQGLMDDVAIFNRALTASEISTLYNPQTLSLVHQLNLGYATATNSGQLLQSITEVGSDSASVLPATRFDYKPVNKSWNTTSQTWINNAPMDVNLTKTDVELADANGDGLLDIVKSEGSSNNTWKVWKNTGSGWNTTYDTWVNNQPMAAKLDRADTRMVDVTGDGLPDIVKSEAGSSAGKSYWYVWRNTGSSWTTPNETWINNANLDAYFAQTTPASTVLVDVNGDGLPDIVKSWWNAHIQYDVYKNTGSSWSTTAETWLYNSVGDVGLNDQNVRLIDVNGDGLPDIVRSTFSGTNATWTVYKNTGSGWSTTGETWINNAAVDANFTMTNVTVQDVNGDGLPDIVKSIDNGSNDTWEVLLNQGNSWSTTWVNWIDPSSNVDLSLQSNTQMFDANGDGLPDIIKGYDTGSPAGSDTWQVWKNNGNAPDLLADVYTAQGGKISFDYNASTNYSNTGNDSFPDLPFTLWVVQKMTADNGMTNSENTNDVTTYLYKNGFYKWQDHEFRGFGEVDTVEPNTSKKQTLFNQDDAAKGRIATASAMDASNLLYTKTEDTWSNSLSNGVYTVNLTSEKNYTYDGSASNPKIIENDYQYDGYGNVTKKSELGDTSTNTDDRFTYNEYTASTSAWIINTLKHTYLNKSDDSTKVSESWFYYDGNANWTDTPSKGDLTKKVDWLSGGTNPQTTYAYDSYGNQTSVTDANSHTTSTAYDTATHTYPISKTNAKNQTTTYSYDLGTGNLLSQIDPNGLTTSYQYDVFGRITKEIKPFDSSSYPTTSYSYFLDGIAPEGMLVSKRKTSSASATLDTYTIVDGLGRKIQTRTDAEDPTKQIVSDTFYDATGQVEKETVPYLASTSAITVTPTPPPASKFGDGSDGSITISSNTTDNPIDSSVTATSGTTTATVGSGLGFAQNQIVMFHQTQGTNAGAWEYARVRSYSGTTLTLTAALTNSYSSSGGNHAQVRVVPQYHNVTVNSGVTWTAKAWNGTTGGLMTFLADGTVTNNGTITATGQGFIGNPQSSNGAGNGLQGEGTPGVGSRSTSANSNGGGGGRGFTGSMGAEGGGGGGGNASTGGSGATGGGSGQAGGAGGSAVGAADLSSINFGGAGGQGGTDGSQLGSASGSGGGMILLYANQISTSGTITVNGTNGTGGGQTDGGSGGGGAGGSVLIKTGTGTLGTNLITASGGNGGATSAFGGGAGGNGSVGRIRVEYETSLSGTTSPAASTLQTTISQLPAGVAPTLPFTAYVDPDGSAKYTQWTYDAVGRPTIITNPKGDSKTIAYDHWKETTIDENGHINRKYKNAFDKINKVEEVNGLNTYTTLYDYDSRDLLTKITDNSSNQTTFTYDTLGRKTAQTDPDMGTWSYGYDGVGNLTSQTDAKNVTITKNYDELDRVTKVDYPTQTDNTFAYDIGKIGTLSIATDSAGTVNYSYDNRLRKTQEQRSINGTTKTTQFSYDAMDRMTSQTYPDGEVVNFSFNNQGEIDSASGSASLLSNIDYNALGKITKKDFGNGLTTNYTYNSTDFRLNRIQTGSLQDLNYTYDSVGNVASITDNIASKTQNFSYDDLDRLLTASQSGGFNYQYAYNSIGNLTKFTNAGIDTNYTYGSGSALPHALTSSTATSSATTSLISLVQKNKGSGGGTGSVATSFTSNVSTGNMIVVMTITGSGSNLDTTSVTDNQGNTYTQIGTTQHTAGNNYLRIWYAKNVTGGSVTVTAHQSGSASGCLMEILEYSGADTASPADQSASTTGTNTSPSGGSITPTKDGSLVISAFTDDNSDNVSITGTSGYTVEESDLINSSSTRNGIEDKVQTTAAATTGTWTTGSSANWAAAVVSFKPLVTGGTQTGTATPALVQKNKGNGGGTGSVATSFTSNVTTGNAIVVMTITGSGSNLDTTSVTDNQSNTYTQIGTTQHTAGNNYIRIWYAKNVTGGSVTVTAHQSGSASGCLMEILEYSGLSTSSPAGQSASTTGTSTSPSGGSITTTSNNSLILSAFTDDNSDNVSITGTSGYTVEESDLINSSSTRNGIEDKVQTTAGAITGAWTTGSSANWAAVIVSFTPATIASGSSSFTYDANGNMTSDGTNCYHFNEANQMDQVKTCSTNQVIAEYVYDYNGNRMVKRNFVGANQLNSVISWSDAFETTVATSGAQLSSNSYYFVNGQLIAKKDTSGNRTFFHNDHLGSTSLVTNQSGSQVEVTKYDPWGKISAGGTSSKFLYTGQEHDSETNLEYYNARYYNSDIRHFTQPDDIIQNIYDPQTLNRYSYVRNNPLKYTDPTGHAGEILAYNNALNNYYNKPSATTYNNVLNTSRSIQTQSYSPGQDKDAKSGGVQDSAKPVYNSLLGNDIKTLKSPNASLTQKSWAVVGVIGSVYVPARAAELPKFYKFGDGLLADHFLRHAAKMGYKTAEEYVAGANKLFQGGDGVEGAVRSTDGAYGFFKPSTGEFGTLDSVTNRIKTYYIPDGNPVEYWYNKSGFFK